MSGPIAAALLNAKADSEQRGIRVTVCEVSSATYAELCAELGPGCTVEGHDLGKRATEGVTLDGMFVCIQRAR